MRTFELIAGGSDVGLSGHRYFNTVIIFNKTWQARNNQLFIILIMDNIFYFCHDVMYRA